MELTHHNLNYNNKYSKLLWVTLLNLSITIIQFIGGLLSNSLSLLSDSIHNLADSSAIFFAYLANKISLKKPTPQKTFGYKRAEILAALFNSLILIVVCIFLFFEAYKRFNTPEPIKGQLMLIIATFGLLANFICVLVLHNEKTNNLNTKAAYLHLLGDTLSSVAVIAGGAAIYFYNIYWIDPIITIFVGFYIIRHTWKIVKKTIDILMQGAPENININEIKEEVEKIKEVDNIHHIHIWELNDSQIYLEAHLNLKNNIDMKKMMSIKTETENLLHNKFKINHTTLQTGYNCCNGDTKLIYQ